MHTGFTLDGPLIGGINAVTALWRWLHGAVSAPFTAHDALLAALHHASHHASDSTSRLVIGSNLGYLQNESSHQRIDSCAHGRFYPPCGKKCQLTP